jgi:hypothetical protein
MSTMQGSPIRGLGTQRRCDPHRRCSSHGWPLQSWPSEARTYVRQTPRTESRTHSPLAARLTRPPLFIPHEMPPAETQVTYYFSETNVSPQIEIEEVSDPQYVIPS